MGELGGILFLLFLVVQCSISFSGVKETYTSNCLKAGGVAVQTVLGHTCIKAEEIKLKEK